MANKTSQAAGRASTFMRASAVVVIWAVTGPLRYRWRAHAQDRM
ncbi:low affinity iron permease family protein [Tardiphaga sp. 709]